MIASLRGRLEHIDAEGVVISLGGISLRVQVPLSVMERLGGVGEVVELFTSLQVREDSLTLYGFDRDQGRRLFELLLTVSGVGPRHALSLLSTQPPEGLAAAIISGDTAALARAPGVGRRIAERLVVELHDHLEREWGAVPAPARSADGDVVAALMALGYSAAEARRASGALSQEQDLPLEERVRRALQELGQGRPG